MTDINYSIVIPAYNASVFIERAIRSVKAQETESWEIIVVENGSTDDTFEKCKALEDGRIHVYQSAKGVSNARNLGIDKAQGEWLIFLDADDELIAGALKSTEADINSELDLISYRYEHNEITKDKQLYSGVEEIQTYTEICLKDPTQRCNSTAVLFRRTFLNDANIRFKSELSHAEDSVFLISCLMKANKVKDCCIPIYRVIPNSNSAVRSMSDSTIDSYCASIRAIETLLLNSSPRIDNAYSVFVLSQLLVILVNGPYKSSGFINAVKKTKELCNRDPFVKAVKKVDISELPVSRRITFLLMKLRMHFFVGVIIKLRIMLKNSAKRVETIEDNE